MAKKDNKQRGFGFGDFELFAAESAGITQTPAEPTMESTTPVHANFEYLSKDGEWRSHQTLGFSGPDALIHTINETLNKSEGLPPVAWRLRVRR